MTKMEALEMEALEVVIESMLTHQKCPDLQKSLDDKVNSAMNDLAEAKAKIESDTEAISKLKKMCETQLRKNADLQKEVQALREMREKFEFCKDIENDPGLLEHLEDIDEDNRILNIENEGQKEFIKDLFEDIDAQTGVNKKLKQDIERLMEENEKARNDRLELNKDIEAMKEIFETFKASIECLKQTNLTLMDDNARQNEVNKQLIDDDVRQKDVIKTLKDDIAVLKESNEEFKNLIKNILEDNESAKRRFIEIENKLSSSNQ